MIDNFHGEYRFLSNFYMSYFTHKQLRFPTVEHAYQFSKTVIEAEQMKILHAIGPGAAKRMGRAATIRPDWEEIKIPTMRELLMKKFSQNKQLSNLLIATGDQELIEGNSWGDRFWGQCPIGVGENWLGRLLTELRTQLR